MSKLFISHSSQDDGFVRDLQQALGDLGQDVWIDSRELRGGDPLWPEIQKAIEEASAYAVVVSPASLQSKWVGKELRARARTLQTSSAAEENVPQFIPAVAEWHETRRAGRILRREPLYIPRQQRRGRESMRR